MSETRFLEPRTECGSCLAALDDMEWAASSTFRVGEWALGVRSSDADIDAALRRVLAAHLVEIEAPANFSALMADEQARTFHFLYRASDALVRTRAAGRVLRTLIAHLSAFADPSGTVIRLDAAAVIVDGRAIVVPASLRAELGSIETRLNVAGMTVGDSPTLYLDPGTASVIVPEPALTVDTDALADFERAQRPPPTRELDPVPAGRYPIGAWALVSGPELVGPIGRAQAVAAVTQLVANADEIGAQQALDAVADALKSVPVSGLWWFDSAGLVTQLRELAGGA
jgi:hypothetical protein